MKLLDTNVFIYAQGGPSAYKEPCLAILARAKAEPGSFGVDVEALQEILEVYGRRGDRRVAVETVEDALLAFPDPFPVTRKEIEEALDLVKGYLQISPRDAIHAAMVFTHRLEGIVSSDRAFDQVAGLTRFDPRDLVGA